MKNILIFTLLTGIIISCQRDGQELGNPILSTIQSKEFIPDHIKNTKSIVFEDENKSQVVLVARSLPTTDEKDIDGKTYKVEGLNFLLENVDRNFILNISASIPETNGKTFGEVEVLSIGNNEGSLGSLTAFSYISLILENFEVNENSPMIWHEVLSLHGKEYKSVYESVLSTNPEQFGKVYYNSLQGIIGFTDGHDNLWTFVEVME